MKFRTITFIMIFINYSLVLNAQNEKGISFSKDPWQEVLSKARQLNKLIFVDVYTTWCAPCKRMAAEVFIKDEVGNKFNSRFINYQVDAEKGEGVLIAKQYKVRGFPTYLFIDGNGKLYYTITSYLPPAQFIMQADIAEAEFKDPKPFYQWEAEYPQKKNDAAFLRGYIEKRNKLGKYNADLLNEYFNLIPKTNWLDRENLRLVLQSREIVINSPIFNQLATNLVEADEIMKDELSGTSIHDLLYTVQLNSLQKAIASKDESLLENGIIRSNKIVPSFIPLKPCFIKPSDEYYRLYFYKNAGFYSKFIAKAPGFYEQHYLNLSREEILQKDTELREKALSVFNDSTKQKGLYEMTQQAFKNYFSNNWTAEIAAAASIILRKTADNTLLEKASSWINRVIEIRPLPGFYLTKSLLEYKTGKIQAALTSINESIAATTDEDELKELNNTKAAISNHRPIREIMSTE